MDKKTLVIQKELSTDMEFSGDFLLKEQNKKHIKIDAAMWFFYAEINDWKYILVFDEFSQKGSSFVYEAISDINRKALSKRYKRIPLNYIEVKSNTSFIYKSMKGLIHMQSGRVRIANSMINNFEINDCLIYRYV